MKRLLLEIIGIGLVVLGFTMALGVQARQTPKIYVKDITLEGAKDPNLELQDRLNSINGTIISVIFIGPALNYWEVVYTR